MLLRTDDDRPSVRLCKQALVLKILSVRVRARYTERDREAQNCFLFKMTITNTITTITTTFTKCYKVTLYSDLLRVTVLYTIYRNIIFDNSHLPWCRYIGASFTALSSAWPLGDSTSPNRTFKSNKLSMIRFRSFPNWLLSMRPRSSTL